MPLDYSKVLNRTTCPTRFSDIERYRTKRYIFQISQPKKILSVSGRLSFETHNRGKFEMAAREALEVQRSGFLLTFHHLESFVFHLFSSRTLSLRIVIYVH